MLGNPRQYVAEPGELLHAAPLAGGDEAQQHRCRPAATVAAEEPPVPTSHRHHLSILPISGRKMMSTIDCTRFTVDDCGCSTVNNVRAAALSMSRWRPAQ